MIQKPYRQLYLILTLALVAGYAWLFYTLNLYPDNPSGESGVCLFREVTGVPCPSCGSTRSIAQILKGDMKGALLWNPFGFIIMVIMLVMPVWLVIDLVSGKDALYRFYVKLENILKIKWVAVATIILVLANWAWNIAKGL